MGAMTLVLDQRGTKVNLTRAHVLCLTYPDGSQHRVGLDALRRIVIQGDISLSSALLRSCQDSGVGIILLPGRRRRGESIQLLPNRVVSR
ncbi:MAG: hypothetical protein HC877_12855 [Thioploca sp.]|nr:hypothetical protein [Thioploca sp.]